jgi:hypothetical protein
MQKYNIISNPVGLMPNGLKIGKNNSKLSIKFHYSEITLSFTFKNLRYTIIYSINQNKFLLILLSFW